MQETQSIINVKYGDALHNVLECAKGRKRQDFLVLDVGFGRHAPFSRIAVDKGLRVIGLELDEESIEATRGLNHNFALVRADAQHLPFRKRSFTFIVALEVIEHLPSPRLFLKDAYLSLKDDGRFVISTPNPYGPWELLVNHLLLKIYFKITRRKPYVQKSRGLHGHVSLLTFESLVKTLSSAGFQTDRYATSEGMFAMIAETLFRIFNLNRLATLFCIYYDAFEAKISERMPKQLVSGWILIASKVL